MQHVSSRLRDPATADTEGDVNRGMRLATDCAHKLATAANWHVLQAHLQQMDERRHALEAALHEIIAINYEDQGTFRKRGGTRRGLSIVAAREAIAKATGSDE